MGFEKTASTRSHPTYRSTMLLRTVLCVCLYKSATSQQHPYYFEEDSSQAQQAQYYQGQAVYQNPQPADRFKRKQTFNEGYSQNENVDRRYYEQEEVDRRYYENNYKEEEEDYAPKPFSYEYGGADHDGRHFAKTESKDEDGVVKGEYRVELPDGRVQIVSYRADPVLGYQANVRYEGEARPEPPRQEDNYLERKKFVPNYDYKPYARARY